MSRRRIIKVPQMIAAELQRLVSTPMSVIALIALLCVPVLYGGLYLWANQDPYGRLSEIPAALVVSDEGAQLGDDQRNIGSEVADELLSGNAFDWHRVSAEEATTGLDDGTYDFAVEIPADFTAAIASIASGTPRQAELTLHTNDANSYLAGTIGAQAIARIQNTVTEKAVHEAGLTVLEAMGALKVSLSEAADGAARIDDGLRSAASGAGTLQDGSVTLADGAASLRSGASSLADGAARVAEGTAQLRGAADEVAAASAAAIGQLPVVREDVGRLLQEAGLPQDRIDAVLSRLDGIGEHLVHIDDTVQATVSQVDQLADGAAQVADGSSAVDTGAASLADGAVQVRDGAATLNDGLAQLVDGADQLSSKLGDGVARIPDIDADTQEKQASTLAAPVSVDSDAVTHAQNYGAGLAPFFAALAAWIGIYALFLIVKPVSRRAVTALRSPIRVTMAGWATPALLGGVQMIALFGVLSLALGFQFANPLATLGLLVLASMTYTAIILALNVWLGSVGQFLGLVLMVAQLVTAGGTFPWQTLPEPLAALHHVLPMGYVVDAMRQVMYGGDMGRVGLDIAVLVSWLAAAAVIAALGVMRMTRFRTLRDLEPSLIG